MIRGSPCFRGLSQFVASKDCWQELIINRLSMGEIMCQDELSNNKAHKIFVMACHKALRTEYAKLFNKAKDDDYIQLDKLRQKIRYEIIVCVDAKSFRRWLVRFWSGCSENVADFNDIDDLLPSILVESNWELFQDLALVSLVTYQKAPEKPIPPPVKEDSSAKKLGSAEDSTT
jgi:CRISPR-associated protein Cas8a1/Csx13